MSADSCGDRVIVPDEAFQAAVNIGGTMRKLEAAAPLIVAAWADQVAAEHMPPLEVEDYDEAEEAERFGVRSMCTLLQRLAAELRGGEPRVP